MLLAFGGVTCTDAPTGPGRGHGGTVALRLAPSFSAAAAAAFDGLGAFGLSVDNVHIHIDHPPAPPFDIVVDVPPGADSLPLDLQVVLNGPTEVLTLQIELRDGTQVLFSGTQTVTATVGRAPAGPPAAVPFTYVGPGAGATHLAIAPRDTTIRMTGGVQYRFDARDDANAPVAGTAVAWRLSDATLGTISAAGAFTPSGREGITRVVVSTPNGLRDSTSLAITAPPTQLALVSGGGQTGAAGAALDLPLEVEARTAAGTPVPGVLVTFAAPATGGVAPDTATTDLTGRARTTATLGHAAGAQTFGAAAAGLTGVSANETATAAVAATLARISGDAQIDTAHAILSKPLVVRVTDAFGNPVTGATVDWARVAGGGAPAAASTQSDTAGLASVDYTLGATPGTDTISATLHGVSASTVLFTALVAQKPASIAIVSGNGQAATVGTALPGPLVVRVLDTHAKPVPGATVAWTATAGGGTVAPATSVTDSTGATQAALVVGAVAGLNTVTAAVDSAIRVTFTATATAGVATTIVKLAGDAQSAAAGAAVAVKPSVRVSDAGGNPVSGAAVSFAVTAGGGSVTGGTATTDGSGVATVGGWTLGASGAQALTATSGSLSALFSATISGPPSAIVSTAVNTHLDTLTALGDTYQLTAQSRDTANAVVASPMAWVSRTPAAATVDAAGLVTAVANGSSWIVATDTSAHRDSALVVVQQRVATVLVSPASRNIYLTRTYTLTASAVDGRGHPMAGSPVFTWATSAAAVATVTSGGLVTGLTLGPAQITATTGGVTGVAAISIVTPITRIEVGRDAAGVPVQDTTSLTSLGITRRFRAIAHDTLDAPMTGVSFTWSSTNGAVALLDSSAAVAPTATSAANGVTAITATAQGITGTASLKVAQQLARISMSPETLYVAVSGSGAVTARGLDANNRFMSGGAFTYASQQTATATVNSGTGVVTGVANGTTFVTATSGSITSDTAAVVQVGGSVPAAISFGRDTLSVGRGSSVSIPIYLSKPNASAVTVHLTVGDTAAYWSSANVVIAAGQTAVNATLNGHNAGTTVVTAADSSGTGFTPDTAVLAVQATMKLTNTSYVINATDQANTQVLLSDPSPAGGTYVTFNFGTAGKVTVWPNPAFIPAGQLAADIQITAIDSGTTTITPNAIGVNGTASNFTAYGAWLRFGYTALRLGTGQYDNSMYLYVPTYNNVPVPIALTSSDTTVLTVPATVTIPGGGYYLYFTSTALAPGTATITASAPGWNTTNSVAATVTTPHVGIGGGTPLVTTSPQSYASVYAEDSVKTPHYRTNSLVVRLRSTDSTVMKVLDSVVTIAPGAQSTSTARVIPGGLGGTAYIVASASGHTPDSTLYTVTGPKLTLNWTANRLGLGQQDQNLYVSTPNNVTSALTVTLFSADTTIVGVPTTVTIPAGAYYAYFNVRGNGLGTMPIVASAPGYQSDTGTYTVTTPRILLAGGTTINNFSPARSVTLAVADSLGSWHYRMTPLVVSLASSDTTVLRSDSASVTIPAGAQYTYAATVTPTGVGAAKLRASAPGHGTDSTSFTVQIPKLGLSFATYTIGKGQHRLPTEFYVSTPDNRTSPLAVTFTQKNAAVDSLTGVPLTIDSATYYSRFGFYGLTMGMDTVITSAPGYQPDTAYIRVTTPKLGVSGLPGSTTTTNPPIGVTVYAQDSVGGSHYVTDTLVVAAVSSDTTVLRPAQAYFRIIKDAQSASTTVNVVGPGTASITYSDSAGTGYLPATTNTVTVTGPSLSFSTTSTMLGMRQSTGASGIWVSVPNAVASPLVVHLASTGTRVATVPDSVVIPTTFNVAYFGITAQDTVGTIQIQATATGYGGKSMTTQVTVPKFAIYTSAQANTTSPKQGITVSAQDANGTPHYTTENVTVTLTSASPSVAAVDSTTVTILAGTYSNNLAAWSPGLVGSTQLSASDARAALYKYTTATTNTAVVTPSLALGWNSTPLGIGQYFDTYVNTPDYQQVNASVTLAHLGTAFITTVPASAVTIDSGGYQAPIRVIGLATGTDTLVASLASPLHHADTAYTVVGPGRIDPLIAWPTSLTAGDSVAITLYARTPTGATGPNVLAATTWTLSPNANIEFRSGGAVITSVTVPAGAQSVTFYVKALSAGTASATITAANYQTYTNTFTVNP